MLSNLRRRQTTGLPLSYLWLVLTIPALITSALVVPCLITSAFAADHFLIRGTVKDSSGAVIAGAKIELFRADRVLATTASDREGNYQLEVPAAEKYRIRISASSFRTSVSNSVDVSQTREANLDTILQPEALNQQITVTATGLPTPEAELGFSVTVIKQDEFPTALNVQQPLLLIPGVQMSQSGQLGNTTSLFIRGGSSDANEVLVDGLPASFVGGGVEFAALPATGVDQVEVLRGPNSALYGSDALAGVVSLTTERGSTPLPQITYQADGGNFGTYFQQGTLGGAYKGFDYFSAFSVINTRNGEPENSFHNGTYAGNFGWTPRAGTSLRVTVRHVANHIAVPNAIQLYEIPDAAGQEDHDTYVSATFENQTTERWHNLVRYGMVRLREPFTDYAPTGIPADCFGDGFTDCYLGAPVTLHGANGYTVSGQAIFQYPGTYPNVSLSTASRDFVYAQSDYRVNSHLTALAGFKYEAERGQSSFTGFPSSSTDRGNYSYTMQLAGGFFDRLYYTVGSGIEDNALFGVVATPRASLAYYLFRPGPSRIFSGTKLRSSFSNGVKEPSLFQQTNSLYALIAALSNGSQLIAQFGITPVGAERSRTYDAGVDQDLLNGRARVGLSYFHNEFTNAVESVPQQGLIDLGVPTPVVQAALFGASINSLSYRAQGAEAEAEYKITRNLFARGGYTYLDAVVQKSFSSDALAPTFNPAFPTIPIGVFSPLRGSRPFRLAPHSGYFGLNYSWSRWYGSLTGTFVGRRDDSDFLSDEFGGSTMLLPNRNLEAAYQRLDLSGGYRVNRSLQIYTAMGNVLSQHYSEVFGYPALPFTFRAGIKLTFGGESWRLK
jgi:iron complex outermembrane receptor protein/vitamin B12 transporter